MNRTLVRSSITCFVFVTILLVAWAACDDIKKAIGPEIKPLDGVTAEVNLMGGKYDMYGPVLVRVRLINKSTQDVIAVRSYPLRYVTFDVKIDDKEVPLTQVGRRLKAMGARGSRSPHKIASGEEYHETFHLDRLFEMSESGTYDVTAQILFVGANEEQHVAKSPAVKIERTDPGISLDEEWEKREAIPKNGGQSDSTNDSKPKSK